MNNGIFLNYQMVEALNILDKFDLTNLSEYSLAELELAKLKSRWMEDKIPSTGEIIGDNLAGMQEITLDELMQLSYDIQQADTYTIQNAGAMQYCLQINNDGSFNYNFEQLEKIADYARKHNKKIVIDSAVVFGDRFPKVLEKLDKDTIAKLIVLYSHELTQKFGDVIERIDVLNAIFERNKIDPNNNTEEFWIKTFGEDYASKVINIVKQGMDTNHSNIKLGWSEFYLTNSKYIQRKIDFLKIISIEGLDVISLQDRFMTGTNLDYILTVLDEFKIECQKQGKIMGISEFGCSVSGKDLKECTTEEINERIKNMLNAIREYSSIHGIKIEGTISDKFDYNHKELQNHGFEISTTANSQLPKSDAISRVI